VPHNDVGTRLFWDAIPVNDKFKSTPLGRIGTSRRDLLKNALSGALTLGGMA
jgi:hypothetical protein